MRTPNVTHFADKVAGTFDVPSAILRLTAHGMCLLLSKASGIVRTPSRHRRGLVRDPNKYGTTRSSSQFGKVRLPIMTLRVSRIATFL